MSQPAILAALDEAIAACLSAVDAISDEHELDADSDLHDNEDPTEELPCRAVHLDEVRSRRRRAGSLSPEHEH